MKWILYATSVALVLLLPRVVDAQQSAAIGDTLTLSSAITRALSVHPALDAASAAVARARSGVRDAQAARLPGLTADATAVTHGKPMVIAPLHGFDARQPPEFDRTLFQGSLTAAYLLYDGGARGARIERTGLLEDAAELAGSGVRATLIAQTAVAYNAVVTAGRIVDAHTHRMAALQRERDRAALMFEQGKTARVAVMRADAVLSTAHADGETATSQRTNAQRELARLMKVEVSTVATAALQPLRPAGADAFDRAALSARAREQSPDLQRLRAQLAAAERSAVEAGSTRMPRVHLGARVAEYASTSGLASSEWQTGVQLTYPIFTGGATSAAGQRAAAEVRAAAAEIALAELRIDEAIDRALTAATSSHARVAALQLAEAAQLEVTRIERLALDAGSGIQTDYLTAEAELFRTRAALAQARADEVAARIDLARLTGDLSPAWLNTNLERTP